MRSLRPLLLVASAGALVGAAVYLGRGRDAAVEGAGAHAASAGAAAQDAPSSVPAEGAPAAAGGGAEDDDAFLVPGNAGPEDAPDPAEERAERLATLARLRGELDAARDTPWTIAPGCPRPPTIPAAMAGVGARVFVASEDRVAAYDLDAGTWEEELVRLPATVGTGVALCAAGPDALAITPGGDRPVVWRIELAGGALERLPDPPQPVGRGAALAWRAGVLYLAPGRQTDDFLALAPGATEWLALGRIGGPSKVATTFGRNAGFLTALGDSVYAAPDHHLQRFHVGLRTWGDGVWLAMGFRASLNGGGFAADDEVGSVYAACGMYSRSLNEIVPDAPPGMGGAFHFVRPRLPYPMIGEGDRLAIARKGDEPHLVAYAVEPDNALCLLPCSRLVRLDREDDAADVDTPWNRVDSDGGGSGIRRRAELGPERSVKFAPGTMGVMGALDGELFFMRLANVRRIEPETATYTFYPGINVGAYLGPGCAGTYDGERFLYMTAGGSDLFVRWEIPPGPPEQKPFSGTRRPVNETDLDVLPALPAEVWDGSALAHLDGAVYALRGAGTRDLWRFDVAARRWETLAPLPPDARPPGERGTGLVAAAGSIFAVPDKVVWRYDVAAGSWERFAELPFGPSWDGGMVANDGDRHLYVFRGGVSMRFGRLDLETRAFEDLLPRPPDTLASEGNRIAILTIADERRLYLHRGHNSNEILWIRLADLRPAR